MAIQEKRPQIDLKKYNIRQIFKHFSFPDEASLIVETANKPPYYHIWNINIFIVFRIETRKNIYTCLMYGIYSLSNACTVLVYSFDTEMCLLYYFFVDLIYNTYNDRTTSINTTGSNRCSKICPFPQPPVQKVTALNDVPTVSLLRAFPFHCTSVVDL